VGGSSLGIKACVRVTYRASQRVAGTGKAVSACRDFLDFIFGEPASTLAAEYPVFIIIRHTFLLARVAIVLERRGRIVVEIKICRNRKNDPKNTPVRK
jgi:hypothetical protein